VFFLVVLEAQVCENYANVVKHLFMQEECFSAASDIENKMSKVEKIIGKKYVFKRF